MTSEDIKHQLIIINQSKHPHHETHQHAHTNKHILSIGLRHPISNHCHDWLRHHCHDWLRHPISNHCHAWLRHHCHDWLRHPISNHCHAWLRHRFPNTVAEFGGRLPEKLLGLPHSLIPSLAFRHPPPNSARFSYATEGALFISAQLSTDANSKHWFTTSYLQPLPYLVTPQGPENCQLKPVLNWTNVCSPEHTSDTSTNYDSFLN